MNIHPAWRVNDFLSGMILHGLLLSFLPGLLRFFTGPIAAVWWWLAAATLAGLLCALHDRLGAPAGRILGRTLLPVYLVIVSGYAFVSWSVVWFYSRGVWLSVSVLLVLTVFLIARGWDALLGLPLAAILAATIYTAADACFSDLRVWTAVAAGGLLCLLPTIYADRLEKTGRWFFPAFLVLAVSFGANTVFYRGFDRSVSALYGKPGIVSLIHLWEMYDPAAQKAQLGLELRFVQRAKIGDKERYLVGGERGLYLADPNELGVLGRPRQLSVGPAADNVSPDDAHSRIFAATRDGVLSRLDDAELAVVQQAKLPRGALVTRLAPEGVYAADEWNWIGLFAPDDLQLLREWRSPGPTSDLLPDGRGGFFLTTLTGRLFHHRSDGSVVERSLLRRGLFHLMALDAHGGRLFVSNMAARNIQVFAIDDLSLLCTVPVDRGARNLLWDESLGVLIVGHYFSGDLSVLDGSDFREIGRLNAGRRLRTVAAYEPGAVLTASAGGLFAVKLSMAIPALEKETTGR